MITIRWESLTNVGREYLERLKEYASIHPRSYLSRLIINAITPQQFHDLILCPPDSLCKYVCPQGLNASIVYSVYDLFFQDEGPDGENNAKWLTKRLNIKVCPYCNRTYTFTIDGEKGIRPELDHFYPRSNDKYKHLALSFYNLIPSCPSCNKTKSTKLLDFHPYFGPLNLGALEPTFYVDESSIETDENGIPLLFPDNPRVLIKNQNKNVEVLALEELFGQHSDYAKDILERIMAYNSSMYEPLISSFQGMGRTQEEIDRIIWGGVIAESSLRNRPLSKLTYDLLKQFGII